MSARTNVGSAPASAGVSRHGLLRAAAITAGVALVVNLVILAIATALSDVPERFTPLQPGSVAFMTILGVALAAGLFALVRSRAANPTAAFRKIVPAALLVSLIPDVLIWTGDAYEGAAQAETVLPLMGMHVATAIVVAALLPTNSEESSSR